ncbi:serine/threonine protein kinase [Rheinheimera sp. UJ51]|uniref:serine/threonine protein kinase n=1 Tax=Rheinheimera sp. UJ51 TaxID=2892446 RepID=UPI001E5CEE4C|nr:serine/threonine-protein kinase [Rheinheimera sp. UJ51]MCC5452718.1 serine/threonine protein kinase [Rheinheimera sp. UJ51]
MLDTLQNQQLIQHYHAISSLSEADREAYISKHIDDSCLAEHLRRLLAITALDVTAIFNMGFSVSAEAIPATDFIGKQLGVFKLTSLIGAGGMSSVFAGVRTDGEFEQDVAVKIFSQYLATDGARLNFEAQALASLSHDNIVSVYDAGRTEDGYMYLVMQRVQGQTLNHYLLQHSLNKKAKLKLLLQIFYALLHAHSRQLLHADLKPQNVMIDDSGKPYLLDFGVARLLGATSVAKMQAYIRGLSLDYASPEQISGEHLTTASDVYSAGKLLGFVLGQDSNSVLSAVIDKACAKNPTERYRSMSDMIKDLELYLAFSPVSVVNRKRYHLRLFLYRHRLAVGFAIVTIILSLTAFAIAWQSHQELQIQKLQAAANLEVAQNLLSQVRIVTGNELDRQRQIISAITKLDLTRLPERQAAKLLLALAEAQLVLGDYYTMASYAQKLFDLTQNKASLLPYHLVAQKMLVEMHVHQIRYEDTISGLNYIIDGLKSQVDLSEPTYQKLLEWEIYVADAMLTPFKLRIRDLLASAGGLDNLSLDAEVHLKLLAVRESTYKQSGVNIKALLNEAWALAKQPNTSIVLKLTVLASKAQIENDLYEYGSIEWENSEKDFKELVATISGHHPFKDYAKIFYDNQIRLIDSERIERERLTPLIQFYSYLDLLHSSEFKEAKRYPKLLEKMSELVDPRFGELSYDLLSTILKIYGQMGEAFNFSRININNAIFNSGQRIKGFYVFDQCHNYQIAGLPSLETCQFALKFQQKNGKPLYSRYFTTKMAMLPSLIQSKSESVFDVLTQLLNELEQLPETHLHDTYIERTKRYQIQALIEFDRLKEAQQQLTEYHQKGYSPNHIKGKLNLILLTSELYFQQGKTDEAKALLVENNGKFCESLTHNYPYMHKLRTLRALFGMVPIDSCTDAMKFEQIDPEGKIEKILTKLINAQ